MKEMAFREVLLALTVALAVLLTGCSMMNGMKEDEGRNFDATWPDVSDESKPQPGAIYAQGTDVSLWNNVTARNVGDTLTVTLAESTEAEKNATTSAKKSTDAALTGPTVLGRPVTMNGTPILEGSIGNSSTFAGNGAATQSNKLDGSITVTVAKRFSNGNLLVRGQKWIAINSGREFVRLQGVVRPSDIAPDNTVFSWRVADAYISYGGQGTVANAAKPGWLYRFFNSPKTPF
jgi:flagellar L-ring protein precursor FlgH